MPKRNCSELLRPVMPVRSIVKSIEFTGEECHPIVFQAQLGIAPSSGIRIRFYIR